MLRISSGAIKCDVSCTAMLLATCAPQVATSVIFQKSMFSHWFYNYWTAALVRTHDPGSALKRAVVPFPGIGSLWWSRSKIKEKTTVLFDLEGRISNGTIGFVQPNALRKRGSRRGRRGVGRMNLHMALHWLRENITSLPSEKVRPPQNPPQNPPSHSSRVRFDWTDRVKHVHPKGGSWNKTS